MAVKKPNPVMSMIVPGRRALGEQWSKVSVLPNADGTFTVEREETPAPADNTAIFVPSLGNLSFEAVDFILEYKKKDQEYRKSHNLPVKWGWSEKEITEMFHDFCRQKLKHWKGQTVSGPGGWTQREKGPGHDRNNVSRR